MVTPLQPRVCQLSKKEGGSFGFFLRIEKDVKGHLIRTVAKGGPADHAGLKDGDRVLRVNGVFVDTEDHQQVVELIKKSESSVSLTVLDGASYVSAMKQGVDLLQLGCVDSGPSQPVVNGVSEKTHRPRLCYLLKQERGFGFSLKSIKGVSGLFMTEISPLGAASIAGVEPNDRIIQLNGENVENLTHEQMVTKMQASGINMVLLLIDEASDEYFKSRSVPVVASMASVKGLPLKPRIVELTKEASGYGFFLRMEQGHQGHIIRAIDPNSPAEKVGLVDGDMLIAVNGTSVEHLDHENVVEVIKKCGNKTTFLVVDNLTNKLYKQAGISPLCYWNEVHESSCAENIEAPAESPKTEDGPSGDTKLCHLIKGPEGFGFTIDAVRGSQGQSIRKVVKGSPASEAGLEVNDILIEVNGNSVEMDTHNELVERINSCGDQLSLLVVRKEGSEHLKASEEPASLPADLEPTPEPTSTLNDIQEESKAEETAEDHELPQKAGEQDKSSSSAEDNSDDDTQM
ncbi:Na(+)/H(+) exchange regulatory cofactor NHE-RF3 [Hypanus sabinus]|uniref:Na(+)/H(+) exchange regulatory cofactor NHE-RF3 n=1 Tax=Hypanus sabinus TaxID=79690 RepID=UPI0028C43F1C|nr:Na(+)/H(+) exchange regulatory cofactor NHE-RF3 [Hypanus sabinus]